MARRMTQEELRKHDPEDPEWEAMKKQAVEQKRAGQNRPRAGSTLANGVACFGVDETGVIQNELQKAITMRRMKTQTEEKTFTVNTEIEDSDSYDPFAPQT